MNRKKEILFISIYLLIHFSPLAFDQPSEEARFMLYQLEKRLPRSETYSVPANINLYRESKGFTPENLIQSYLNSCQELNIQPFQFDQDSDVYREMLKMQLIWLGVYPYGGYKEATINFFKSVENQLEKNPAVLKKFKGLFKKQESYITHLWDFVQDNLSRKEEKINLKELADFVASLESYSQRFINTKYLNKEEWSHPAYLFYQLSCYKERTRERFDSIVKEMKEMDQSILGKIDLILSAYDEGLIWLQKASLFFLEEKWFFDERQNEYLSIKDLLISFWKPILGFVPSIKPGILRFGEVDGTSAGSVPFLEYPQLLRPLNEKGVQFLKNTSPAKICDLLETVGEALPKEGADRLPEGTVAWPLNRFIYSLRHWEERIERFTEAYDIGCPITMLIANLPHEIAHSFHFRMRRTWKKEFSEDRIVFYETISNYKNEGIAELCQLISFQSLLHKFPMLRHDNLLKHHIFAHKSPGNHHTWGLLWFQAIYEILGRDFKKIFFLASEAGVTFRDFMNSPELQTEEVLSVSSDSSPLVFQREKRRKGPHTYVFPSCVIELEGEAFKVLNALKEEKK